MSSPDNNPKSSVKISGEKAAQKMLETEELLDLGFEDKPTPVPPPDTDPTPRKTRRAPRNTQERLRTLTIPQQMQLARKGERQERIVLERLLGKSAWEALLRNPKLTPPEAARIARMGALPLPLMEIIVNNKAWLRSALVRRALCSNPRLKNEMLMAVLRATPKNELKLMSKQMGYPLRVRQAAQKLMQ